MTEEATNAPADTQSTDPSPEVTALGLLDAMDDVDPESEGTSDPEPDPEGVAQEGEGEGTEEGEQEAPEGEEKAEQEGKPKEEPPPDPKEQRKSRIIAELAGKETAILEARADLDAQQSRLQDRVVEIQKWETTIAKAKTDPLGFLSDAGIDVNTLTRQILNSDAPAEQGAPNPEVQALREELDALKTQQQAQVSDYQQRQQQTAIAAEKDRLSGWVAEHEQDFPLLSSLDPQEIQEGMFELGRSHWKKTKTQLDPSVSARIIEEKLFSYHQRLAKAASKRAGASQSEQAAPSPSSDPGSRTLSKAHGSRTAQDPNTLTDKQREELALELLDRDD